MYHLSALNMDTVSESYPLCIDVSVHDIDQAKALRKMIESRGYQVGVCVETTRTEVAVMADTVWL